MNDKQYLEAVHNALRFIEIEICATTAIVDVRKETERRLTALKAQEDNIKSEMWEEGSKLKNDMQVVKGLKQLSGASTATKGNPMVFDASIGKWRERNSADDKHGRDVLKEFGL